MTFLTCRGPEVGHGQAIDPLESAPVLQLREELSREAQLRNSCRIVPLAARELAEIDQALCQRDPGAGTWLVVETGRALPSRPGEGSGIGPGNRPGEGGNRPNRPGDIGNRPNRPDAGFGNDRPSRINNWNQWNDFRNNNWTQINNNWGNRWQNNWHDCNHWFDGNWWNNHPCDHWHWPGNANWWAWAAWGNVASWMPWNWNDPVYYNYGDNVCYEGDTGIRRSTSLHY